jgi:hypothetical protein
MRHVYSTRVSAQLGFATGIKQQSLPELVIGHVKMTVSLGQAADNPVHPDRGEPEREVYIHSHKGYFITNRVRCIKVNDSEFITHNRNKITTHHK